MRARALIFALAAVSLGFLFLSRRWVYFFPPRFLPLIIFLCVVFIVWAVVDLFTRRQETHTHRTRANAVYLLIPVLAWSLPFSLAPSSFLGSTSSASAISPTPVPSSSDVSSAAHFHADRVIDTNNYYDSVIDMVTHPDQWDGKTIEVSGFVLPKDKASSEAGMPPFGPNDTFGLSRMTMWCCAADAYALGFAVNNTTSFVPRADQWVRIQGTLEVRNSKALYLKATSITPISPPDSPFVYEKK